jgi:tetratricopeptide (TPR) repeat protein
VGLVASLLLVISAECAVQDSWKTTEAAAAKASKAAQFAEAEKLLVANLKYSETLTAKDPRRPRTLFDLAEVYRAEGKYNDAFPLYERALQIYTALYGQEATEIADTLDGEAELYKSLNDYAHAEPPLMRALALRQKLLKPGDADIAQSQNDLGELYTANGAFDKAEPLLLQALASRQKNPVLRARRQRRALRHSGRYIRGAAAPGRPRIRIAKRSAFMGKGSEAIIRTTRVPWRISL